ncbi:hypothetical protein DICSQDRAFT_167563 [Dichomitus squalens LYAD-421 SS1]|uniref:uncharacterized protein n=1 Tax=Dichomitus squalens (strain LYAD-421) TaxID=732165 RepID=UPI0004415051|nr:uncharacterized protein DICSQDRAFT_167563 [Dichomitus squalens LYAD-421 SS1]EJF64407.1 hypothetical protein DICSQDRAFT_167563 [Dichomitus squalens LYAD-421 SS1]
MPSDLAQMASVEKATIEYKRRLNATAPVSRLPNEIISIILIHVVRALFERDGTCYSQNLPHAYPWLNITRVCHAWRAIAYDTPSFWAFIFLTREPVVHTFLALSKQAPLHVATSDFSGRGDHRALLDHIFLHESHRLKEFRGFGDSHAICDFAATVAVGQPGRLLETLELSSGYVWDRKSHVLPSALFQKQHLRLRHLELRRIPFGWENCLFCAILTRLSVSHPSGVPNSVLGPFEHLLSALGRMVALRYLQLEYAIPELTGDITILPSPSRTIILPQLHTIELRGKPLDSANLLNHLTPLPAAVSNLSCHTDTDSSTAKPLIDVLKDHFTRSPALRTVRMYVLFWKELSISGWLGDLDFRTGATQPAWMTLGLYLPLFSDDVTLYSLQNVDMFSGVRNLEVIMSLNQLWPWQDLFAGMPQLYRLSVHHEPTRHLLPALSSVDSQGAEDSAPSIIAPQLCILMLTQVPLVGFRSMSAATEFIDELIEWLTLRCHYGRPIQHLHLTECFNITAADIRSLEEYVPEVHWDGYSYWA